MINVNNALPVNQAATGSSDSRADDFSPPDGVENLVWQLSTPTERNVLLARKNGGYTVQPGDTFTSIAADHGVSLAELIAANPQVSNPNLIHPGQVVNIPQNPGNDGTTASIQAARNTNTVPATELRISNAGLEFITKHEGIRLKLYNDPAGHATIGVGHLVHFGPVDGRASEAPFANGISRTEAMELLRQDVRTAEDAVRRLVDVPLKQNQFDSLVSFTFNVGAGNFENSTLLRKLNQGDYDSVPSELNRWIRGGGKVLPGLVHRRQNEGELFSTPVNSAPPNESPPITTVTEVLRRGSRGENVSLLQKQLIDAGFSPGPVDGIFGPQTESAVRAFQSSRSLGIDGIVGPQTWRALGAQVNSPPPSNTAVTTGPENSAADLWVKSTANIDNLAPEIRATFDDIVSTWHENGGPVPVVTSGNDGRHMNGSRHYRNLAIDLRANNISDSQARDIAADLQARLGDDYDVIFEHFPSNPANDHIHLEYDPG